MKTTKEILNTFYDNIDNIKKPKFISLEKQNRIYFFPNGTIEINDVISINISENGTHRLNTSDGKKHIIPPGWLHIEFDAEHWTF